MFNPFPLEGSSCLTMCPIFSTFSNFAGNTGNLLMVLIPGICIEKDSPFGDSNVCSENGLAYVSFGMWVSNSYTLMWMDVGS